jgi:hypothetical protein
MMAFGSGGVIRLLASLNSRDSRTSSTASNAECASHFPEWGIDPRGFLPSFFERPQPGQPHS